MELADSSDSTIPATVIDCCEEITLGDGAKIDDLRTRGTSGAGDTEEAKESGFISNIRNEGQECDATDATLIGQRKRHSLDRNKPSQVRPLAMMPVPPRSQDYNMSHQHRGRALILCYSDFAHGGPPSRSCAKHDANICKKAFESLNFEVIEKWNLTKYNLEKTLREVSLIDHYDCDALVVVFMSHGGLDRKTGKEFLNVFDGIVQTEILWQHFTPDSCGSLAGKPKLFFIQACRGEQTDKGVQLVSRSMNVVTDSHEESYSIPLYADMLMMWATYPGMYAFKSNNNSLNGSVFLHYLTEVLQRDMQYQDLANMLLTVTREVAIHYESFVPHNAHQNQSKQTPYTVSTLMRRVSFFPNDKK